MARSRVLLLGDCIRLSFQERLTKLLSEDSLEVAGPAQSCGAGSRLAEGVEGWVKEFEPDIACFGCGPWATEDLLRIVTTRDGVDLFEPMSLSDFDRALMDTVAALQRWCGRQVVCYTTPPVQESRIGAASGSPDLGHRLNHWIAQYNEQAMGLLGELNVVTADLHHELARYDDDALAEDGVSLSPVGVELAARAVAKGIYGVVHP